MTFSPIFDFFTHISYNYFMSKNIDKENLILEIATLIESTPNAKPLSLNVLNLLDVDELKKIKSTLEVSKKNRKEELKEWVEDIYKNCKS